MILIALAALTPFIFIPGLQDPSGLPKTLYLSLLAIVAVMLLLKKEVPLLDMSRPIMPWSLVVFIGAIFLSAFWSINPHLFLSQLSLDLSGIALFIYVANCLKSKDLPMAVMILCVMGFLIALSVFIGIQIDPRVSGPGWSVVNEKFFTLLLGGLVPLAIGFIRFSRVDIHLFVGSFSLVSMIAYVILFSSLATYFAIGIVAMVWVFRFVWNLKEGDITVFRASLGLVVFLSIIVTSIYFNPRINLNNMQERISWWQESQSMLVESNFLGVGRGQWQTRSHKRSPIHGDARHGWRPEHAHNDIMEIVGELGPIGLGSLGAFFFMTLLLRTGRMGFWLKLSLGIFLLEGLFWSLLHYAIFVPFIWMIAGMIWVDRKEEEEVYNGAGY